MLQINEVVDVFVKAFPLRPVPRLELRYEMNPEFVLSIERNFQGKLWSDVNMDDWVGVADISVFTEYMGVADLHYYIPSLLIGSVRQLGYLDWGLRGVLPSKKGGVKIGGAIPGNKWDKYFKFFNSEQKQAMYFYLNKVLEEVVFSQETEEFFLVTEGVSIWGCSLDG